MWRQICVLLCVVLPLSSVMVNGMALDSAVAQTQTPGQTCAKREQRLHQTRQSNDPQQLFEALIHSAKCTATDADSLEQNLTLLNEALLLAERTPLSKRQIARLHLMISGTYEDNQLYIKAYEAADRAYDVSLELADPQAIFQALFALNPLAIAQADFAAAQAHVDQMLALSFQYPEQPEFVFFAHYSDTELRMALADWSAAAESLHLALKAANEIETGIFALHALRFKSLVLFRLGDFASALDALNELKAGAPEYLSGFAQLRAINAFFNRNTAEAMQHMLAAIDGLQEQKRTGIRNIERAGRAEYLDSLTTMDNTLLQQRMEINRLQLEGEQHRRQVAMLSTILLAVVFVGLLGFTRHLIKTRRAYRHGAQTDFLTGLANRRHILERGNTLILQCDLHEHPLSVLLFEVDHFKQVHEQLGSEFADEALKRVSQQALACLRKNDEIGRIGGEEFLVLLPNTDGDTAIVVAERIREKIADQHLRHGEKFVPLSVSTGVAAYQRHESLKDTVKRADKALNTARSQGRNCTVAASAV